MKFTRLALSDIQEPVPALNTPSHMIYFIFSQILKETSGSAQSQPCGLLFYQAGVAVITGSIFLKESSGGLLNDSHGDVEMKGPVGGRNEDVVSVLTGSLISGSSDNLRERLYNLQFNNTTELNSTSQIGLFCFLAKKT